MVRPAIPPAIPPPVLRFNPPDPNASYHATAANPQTIVETTNAILRRLDELMARFTDPQRLAASRGHPTLLPPPPSTPLAQPAVGLPETTVNPLPNSTTLAMRPPTTAAARVAFVNPAASVEAYSSPNPAATPRTVPIQPFSIAATSARISSAVPALIPSDTAEGLTSSSAAGSCGTSPHLPAVVGHSQTAPLPTADARELGKPGKASLPEPTPLPAEAHTDARKRSPNPLPPAPIGVHIRPVDHATSRAQPPLPQPPPNLSPIPPCA